MVAYAVDSTVQRQEDFGQLGLRRRLGDARLRGFRMVAESFVIRWDTAVFLHMQTVCGAPVRCKNTNSLWKTPDTQTFHSLSTASFSGTY